MGEKKTLSYCEANGLLAHPDRSTRESANRSIYGLLGKDGEIFSSALRAICNDWVTVSKRRKYSTPMEASLISNDTELGIIENLLKTVEEGAVSYQRYLKTKAKIDGFVGDWATMTLLLHYLTLRNEVHFQTSPRINYQIMQSL